MMAFLTAEAKRHFKRYNKDVQGEHLYIILHIYSFSFSFSHSFIHYLPSFGVFIQFFFCALYSVIATVCEYENENEKYRKKERKRHREEEKKSTENVHTKRGLTRRLYCYVYAYDIILIILF